MGLVFSISNFFITKTSLANKWRSFSSSNLALAQELKEPLSFFLDTKPRLPWGLEPASFLEIRIHEIFI